MKREIRFAAASMPRRPLLAIAAWSVPEALPSAVIGLAIAHAVDDGFLAGRAGVGLAWLAGLLLASLVGAVGSKKVFALLGDLVEPFRDELVRRTVGGSLRGSIAGHADDGALARLTRQIETVRDTYSRLLVVIRNFVTTIVAVGVGLSSIAPIVVALIVPPFLLGVGAFLATLGLSAARHRTAVLADERLATTTESVLAASRDVVGSGAEEWATTMVSGPISKQAAAERSLGTVSALHTLCFTVGGWLPLLIVLFAGPWLVTQGLTTGAIMGGLTYVLFGLQPALRSFVGGVGGSGLRFVVTLGRILDATTPSSPVPAAPAPAPTGAGRA